jgi:microcystin-dependent protein
MSSYLIRLTNNSLLTSVPDGQIDNSTSLSLIGKNVSGFGQYQNDNFVWLLENFSDTGSPISPLQGQLWFNNASGVLKPMVYDNTNWRPLGVTLYSSTSTDYTINQNINGAPVSASQPGDFWFKSDDRQLYINTTATGYQLIGPERVPGFLETKMRSTTVADSTGTNYPVVELIINGENMAIFSQKTFASTATLVATGFPTIYRGVTFKNYSVANRYVTTSTDVALYGIPNLLDETYPRRDQEETIASAWSFQNGISVGNTPSTFNNDGTDNLNIVAGGAGIGVYVNAGANEVAQVLQEGIIPADNNRQQLGNVSNLWKNTYTLGVSAGSAVSNGTIEGNWQLTNNSIISPFADLGNSLGTPVLRWNEIYTGTIDSGSQTGIFNGNWKLGTNTVLLPSADYANNLGSATQRFDTINARTFSAGINNPGNLIGSWLVEGDMLPRDDGSYSLGAPGLAWASASIANIVNTTLSTDGLTAKLVSITDSVNNTITQFDNDTGLTGNLAGRVPTQYAVKTYVDNRYNDLQAQINALLDQLSSALNGFTTVPAGTIMHHAGSNAPSGYLVCDGASLFTTSYPELFSAIGYTYGGAGTSFNIPNLLGEFIRGADMGRGVDAGRNLGSSQTDNSRFPSHYHVMPGDDQLSFADGFAGWSARSLSGFPYDARSTYGGGAQMWLTGNAVDYNGTPNTNDTETRPRNVALLPIIKFRNGS